MNRYKQGLLIGRFQPFHKGHLYLIKKALEYVDSLVIGVGSINEVSADNPLPLTERLQILSFITHQEHCDEKKISFIPLEDFPDDNDWLANVEKKVGQIDVIIGNNTWVNGIFEKAGYKVIRIPYYKRELYEGKQIRSLIHQQKPWEDRIPSSALPLIKSYFTTHPFIREKEQKEAKK